MFRRFRIYLKLWVRSLNRELGSMDEYSRREILDIIAKD